MNYKKYINNIINESLRYIDLSDKKIETVDDFSYKLDKKKLINIPYAKNPSQFEYKKIISHSLSSYQYEGKVYDSVRMFIVGNDIYMWPGNIIHDSAYDYILNGNIDVDYALYYETNSPDFLLTDYSEYFINILDNEKRRLSKLFNNKLGFLGLKGIADFNDLDLLVDFTKYIKPKKRIKSEPNYAKIIRQFHGECDMTYKEYIDEQLINEVLSNELIFLKKYLNMSEQDKAINRAYSNSYYIDDYLTEIDYDISDEFSNIEESFEKIEWLENNDKEILINFGEWISEQDWYISSSEAELYDVVIYEGFVRNQWLIHFSDNAYDIWKDQTFKYGTEYSDYNRLALSTHFTRDSKKYGGFNFAYEDDDVDKYAFDRHGYKYGNEAILFKGDGIKIFHNGDEEPQVIFDGKATKGPLIYLEVDDNEFKITSNIDSNKVLYKSEKIDNIVNWVDTNYAQYRKHLEP